MRRRSSSPSASCQQTGHTALHSRLPRSCSCPARPSPSSSSPSRSSAFGRLITPPSTPEGRPQARRTDLRPGEGRRRLRVRRSGAVASAAIAAARARPRRAARTASTTTTRADARHRTHGTTRRRHERAQLAHLPPQLAATLPLPSQRRARDLAAARGGDPGRLLRFQLQPAMRRNRRRIEPFGTNHLHVTPSTHASAPLRQRNLS